MVFNGNLKFIREEKDISQSTMANYLGISNSRYCHYENEKEAIPIKYLNKCCNFLHVSLDYVFGFTKILQYENYRENDTIDLELSGQRLKELRRKTGLSQRAFCDKMNISDKMVSRYEKGQFLISTEFLCSICKKYKVSADYLLGKID